MKFGYCEKVNERNYILIYFCISALFDNALCRQNLTLLVVRKNTNDYESWCITDGPDAITFISPFTSDQPIKETHRSSIAYSSPLSCSLDNKNDKHCLQYWHDGNIWNWQISLKGKLGIVLDDRWEDFETIITGKQEGSSYFVFHEIDIYGKFPSNTFQLPFSLRIDINAHMYICSGDVSNSKPPQLDCYWIIIGGWEGNSTAIRKCTKGNIPGSGYPKNIDCKIPKAKYEHNPPITLNETWHHFILQFDHGNINLINGSTGHKLLEYSEVHPGFIRKPKLFLSSDKNTGLWKIHEYGYILSKDQGIKQMGSPIKLNGKRSICLSMYVSLCSDCILSLSIRSENDIETIVDSLNISKNPYVQEGNWQFLNYQTATLDPSQTYVLLISTHLQFAMQSDPFWAISSVKDCSERDVRALKLKGPKPYCRMLSGSSNIQLVNVDSNYTTENVCADNTFGKNCLPCDGWSSLYCSRQIICEIDQYSKTICSCSAGYKGQYCRRECQNGFYGPNCLEKCGRCLYENECDRKSGRCYQDECKNSNYVGPLCKTTKLPVLEDSPILIEVNHTSCTIQLSSITKSTVSIDRLEIQYKVLPARDPWRSYREYQKLDENTFFIYRLSPSTDYLFRVILFDMNGNSYQEDIPTVECSTTCQMVKPEDIIITPGNTSASVEIRTSLLSCPYDSLKVSCNGKDYSNHNWNKDVIQSLKPFTKYNFTITNTKDNSAVFKEFQTKEGVPSAVVNLREASSNLDLKIVAWDRPLYPNGEILYYLITCEHYRYLSCNKPSYEPKIEKKANETMQVFENLKAYSVYKIEVHAVNSLVGDSSSVYVHTPMQRNLSEDEVPSDITIKNITKNSAAVDFSSINCAKFKGPVALSVSHTCLNHWCKGITILNVHDGSVASDEKLINLIPYSNYTVEIEFKRISTRVIKKSFWTLPGAPGAVREVKIYCKAESWISLMWLPPDPPYGTLQSYILKYAKSWKDWKQISVPPEPCRLWQQLYCVNVTGLETDAFYNFMVSAKNFDVDEEGTYSESINAAARQESSEMPENLTMSWSDENDLILSWNHPLISNGPIKYFEIEVKNLNIVEKFYVSDRHNATYTYKLHHKLKSREYYTISVNAWNVQKGRVAYKSDYSPPEILTMKEDPHQIQNSNNSITILVPALECSGSECETFVFVALPDDISTHNHNKHTKDVLHDVCIKKKVCEDMVLVKSYRGSKDGDELLIGGTKQIKLKRATFYNVAIVLLNKYRTKIRYNVYQIQTYTEGITAVGQTNEQTNSTGMAALVIIPIVVIIASIVAFRKKEQFSQLFSSCFQSLHHNDSVTNESVPLASSHCKEDRQPVIIPKALKSEVPRKYQKPVKLEDLEKYVKDAIESGELERQHSLFSRGTVKPCEYGSLEQNRLKNRYVNLIAYDHTRVKLNKINGDEFSDYINANYIDGFNIPKAYIATQGPKPKTVYDFWRMVWQENVKHIVMVANVIEGGKKKSEQYWPNINESLIFQDIHIQYQYHEVHADYEYRRFVVTRDGKERTVEQLHFISWPDHGVPLYPQSLVPFLRKVLGLSQGIAPIVIHCSAGVGRTGTIILSDICLRMAAREKSVDFLYNLYKLREQRANMVDNPEQYKLVHLVVLECLFAPHTAIWCNNQMENVISGLLQKGGVEKQMAYLESTDWYDGAVKAVSEENVLPSVIYSEKNRFNDIIPDSCSRVYIGRFPVHDESSSYINAVYVSGFQNSRKFIVSQQPLPNTLGDFWRMVVETECSVVVSLNEINTEDKTSCEFWPDEKINELLPVPYISLTFKEVKAYQTFTTTTITIQLNEEQLQKRTVHIISLKNWCYPEAVPPSVDHLVHAIAELQALRGDKNVITTCYDGATASGLFVAFSFVVERIQVEHICDVCLAVRTVRQNRKQFVISSKQQFEFLYKAAMKYVEGFETYSNFTH